MYILIEMLCSELGSRGESLDCGLYVKVSFSLIQCTDFLVISSEGNSLYKETKHLIHYVVSSGSFPYKLSHKPEKFADYMVNNLLIIWVRGLGSGSLSFFDVFSLFLHKIIISYIIMIVVVKVKVMPLIILTSILWFGFILQFAY
jgi:hypothetical protein